MLFQILNQPISRIRTVVHLELHRPNISSLLCQSPRDNFEGGTNWGLVLVHFRRTACFNIDWGGEGLEVRIDGEGAPLLVADIFEVDICAGFWKDENLVALVGH